MNKTNGSLCLIGVLFFGLCHSDCLGGCSLKVLDDADVGRIYVLENSLVKVSVIPKLGGVIYDYVHKPTGHNFFFSRKSTFHDLYGFTDWLSCCYMQGVEYAGRVLASGPERAACEVCAMVEMRRGDRIRITRTMSLYRGSTALTIDVECRNVSNKAVCVRYATHPQVDAGGGGPANDVVLVPTREGVKRFPASFDRALGPFGAPAAPKGIADALEFSFWTWNLPQLGRKELDKEKTALVEGIKWVVPSVAGLQEYGRRPQDSLHIYHQAQRLKESWVAAYWPLTREALRADLEKGKLDQTYSCRVDPSTMEWMYKTAALKPGERWCATVRLNYLSQADVSEIGKRRDK